MKIKQFKIVLTNTRFITFYQISTRAVVVCLYGGYKISQCTTSSDHCSGVSGPLGSWIVCCLHLKLEFRLCAVFFDEQLQ